MTVDSTPEGTRRKLLPLGITPVRAFAGTAVCVVLLTAFLMPLRTALVVALAVLTTFLYWAGIVIARMHRIARHRIAHKNRKETARRKQREHDQQKRERLRRQIEERAHAEEQAQVEEDELTRLGRYLWNGYSTTALTGLKTFSEDTEHPCHRRAQALELMAEWYEVTGNLKEYAWHRELALRLVPEKRRDRTERNGQTVRNTPHHAAERRFDVIMVSDFSSMGGTSGGYLQELRAQAEAGLDTGIVHQPFVGRGEGRSLNSKLLTAADNEHTELVRPEDGVSCDLLILRHPKAVERLLERTPRIDARRVLLVVNQPPFHYYGEEVSAGRSWDVDRVRKALAGWKEEVEWAPIGPVVREALLEHHAEELRDVRLTEEDWVNIVDLPAWQRSGRRAPDGKVRIGRHSRDYSTKWPETPELLSAIYPEEDGYEIHVLGGARTAAEVRGALPLNWVVHPFHGLSTREFLHGLDVYVYYTNSAYVEAFGRAPLEAMAAGVPTILPPCFRDLFGEAAIYAEPGDVRRTIDTLVADSGRYRMQVERAWEVLEERFGHDAHLRRLSALGVRARGGVHWQRVGLALDRWPEPRATG